MTTQTTHLNGQLAEARAFLSEHENEIPQMGACLRSLPEAKTATLQEAITAYQSVQTHLRRTQRHSADVDALMGAVESARAAFDDAHIQLQTICQWRLTCAAQLAMQLDAIERARAENLRSRVAHVLSQFPYISDCSIGELLDIEQRLTGALIPSKAALQQATELVADTAALPAGGME